MADQMSKVTIVTRREKFEELREALLQIGVMGMTVTEVRGCGVQSGKEIVVRGVKKQIHLIEKIKVDIVVCTVPVDKVVAVAKKVLQTGKIGDGKIFVSDIKRVIRIRTGEEDKIALNNEV